MKKLVDNFLSKLANIQYLSAWVVLVGDLILSIFGTAIAVVLLEWITRHNLTVKLYILAVVLSLVVSSLVFLAFKTYRKAIRHTTFRDIGLLGVSSLLKCLSVYLILLAALGQVYGRRFLFFAGLADFVSTFVILVFVRCVLIFTYERLRVYFRENQHLKRVLIYGIGDKSVALITRLQKSTHYAVVGFIEYGNKTGIHIADYQVYHFTDEKSLAALKSAYGVEGILFSMASDAKEERNRLVAYALNAGLSIYFAPGIDEVQDGKVTRQIVREIHIEDLLGREEIQISLDRIKGDLDGKVVMVTGAAGSIGSELCRQLAKLGCVKKLVLFDNAETPMHTIRLELEEKYPGLDFVPVIGDVRQLPRLDFAFRTLKPQIVFHAAAYKHVPLMEENPCEAVLVNAVGSRQVADKCIEYGAEKMVMISTDKAVNPTNIMGCTKRLAEIYVQSLGLAVASGKHPGKTRFITTRFGNVLGSNGSVIPRFREQILNGGPVTVTHPDINRFFMTIPEACRLVMEAATLGSGNQIFVFDMGESVKIVDLATRMIELAGFRPGVDIDIEFTGLRPGEKLYEEVLATSENTDPTSHDRIRVARVRDYSYEDAAVAISKLEVLSREVNIPEMVQYMKDVVPEYISQNSVFSKYDRKQS